MQINFPHNVILLRGNHECRSMTEHFTFREECLRKYDQEVYDSFIDTFYFLPIAAIINNEYFCIHGGISPYLHNVKLLVY